MKKLLLIPLIAMMVGCSDIQEHRYKSYIVSVYYHEQGRYSVGKHEDGMLKIIPLPRHVPVDIYLHPTEDAMWYECDYTYDRWDGARTGGCEIHVFDVDDIGTAGWNHGKFGSGTTTRIDK